MDKKILDKFDYAPEVSGNSENKAAKDDKRPVASVTDNRTNVYFEQLLCLCLLAVISYFNSGLRVAVMAGFSLCGAILMDIIGCAMSKKVYNPKDLSTLMVGFCIALLMPAGIDYRLVFFGSALTIGIKHIFGGKNNYIFNPTAAAFVFMLLCYPNMMLLFPKPLESLPVWGEINPILLSGLTPLETVSTFDILLGRFTGAMGTVHILVILVIGICLFFRRSVSAAFTITAVAANIVFSGALGGEAGFVRETLTVLISGYFLFILVFLANDPQTLPKTFLGKIYYGLLFAGMAVLFRSYGKVEGYPAFALLFVNTMSERSDILASQTISNVRRAVVFAQGRLNSYERIMEDAEIKDEERELDTFLLLDEAQEIIIDRQDYNMPPVDNKIIKINRKKRGLVLRFKEKLGSLSEKRKLSVSDEPETSDINFLENLKDGFKDLGGVFKRRESFDEFAEDIPVEKITPLDLEILIDEDDIVEVEVKEDKKENKDDRDKKEKPAKKKKKVKSKSNG
jgi:electron transport complex protein RnfD